MTTERKNSISELKAEQVKAIIAHAYALTPTLHLISERAFRAIISEIGHRDRPRNKDGKSVGHWCDETILQLANATAYSCGAVRDVIRLATTVGVLRTVGQSGYNKPMRRTIDIDAMGALLHDLWVDNPRLASPIFARNSTDLCAESTPPLRGTDTAPPIKNQDIYQHTQQVSRKDKTSTVLIRVGTEYAKKELQKAQEQGRHIDSPEAWKKTVSKKVSQPDGVLYALASDLVASNPDLPPDQLAELLIMAERAPQVTTAEKLSPELDTALSALMGHVHASGMEAAMEYCKEHLAHLAPELLLRPAHLVPELLAALTELNWSNARSYVAQRSVKELPLSVMATALSTST